MGIDDKVKNAAQEAKGKVKEGWGKATNDPETEAEGKLDQAGAFGREYVHNVGVAARTVSRVSGATHVAKMAISVGADPLTAGAIAGATLAAGSLKPRSTRPESSQIAPHHRASATTTPAPQPTAPSPASLPTVTVTPAMAAAARQEEARQKLLRDIKSRHASRATTAGARPVQQGRRSA